MKIKEAYELGKRHAEEFDSLDDAYRYMPMSDYNAIQDLGLLIAHEAGFVGNEAPRKVQGWRYGKIPASGFSYNYRDNRTEAGVSLMEIDGEETPQDAISAMFIAASGRPVVRVTGWLNTNKRGSDGEPLVFWAEEIK